MLGGLVRHVGLGHAKIRIASFLHCEHAAVAIEYAMIGGLVSIMVLLGVTDIGRYLFSIFSDTSDALAQ